MPMVRERPSLAPRQFIEVTPGIRRALELLAEASIQLLDEIDAPSEDLEEDDPEEDADVDEPTLGWPEDPDHWFRKRPHPRQRIEEQDGELEPSFGWTNIEASWGFYVKFMDGAEEDDPGEDGHDAEAEWDDSTLTLTDTSRGYAFASAICSNAKTAMALREAFDPRLARRPLPDDSALYRPGVYPRFPHEPADRPPLNLPGELRRLNGLCRSARRGKNT